MPELEVIAHIRTDFPSKFGIPRQSGLVDALKGTIVFTEAYWTPAPCGASRATATCG